MSALFPSSAAAVSPRVVIATFRVEAGDVEEVWVWHLTLAASAGAEVEVESRARGGAVVVSTSCVVGVAGPRRGFGCCPYCVGGCGVYVHGGIVVSVVVGGVCLCGAEVEVV